MGLCWQMPKFIVWRLWSIYFDHHLPLKPSIGKRRKQSCTPNQKIWCNAQETVVPPVHWVPASMMSCCNNARSGRTKRVIQIHGRTRDSILDWNQHFQEYTKVAFEPECVRHWRVVLQNCRVLDNREAINIIDMKEDIKETSLRKIKVDRF